MSMKVIYSHLAAEKCRLWSANAKLPGTDGKPSGALVEVPWMQEVEIRGTPEDCVLYIPDVHLFDEASVSGGAWEVSDIVMNRFNMNWFKAGKDLSRLLGLGHSHASMGCFQSGEDREYVVKLFARKGICVANTWNAKGEVYGEVTIFTPMFHRFEKVPVEVEYPAIEVDLAPLYACLKRKTYANLGSTYNAGMPRYYHPTKGWVDVPPEHTHRDITLPPKDDYSNVALDFKKGMVSYKLGTAAIGLAIDIWKDRMLTKYDTRMITMKVGKKRNKSLIRYLVRGGNVWCGLPKVDNGVTTTSFTKVTDDREVCLVMKRFMEQIGYVEPPTMLVKSDTPPPPIVEQDGKIVVGAADPSMGATDDVTDHEDDLLALGYMI